MLALHMIVSDIVFFHSSRTLCFFLTLSNFRDLVGPRRIATSHYLALRAKLGTEVFVEVPIVDLLFQPFVTFYFRSFAIGVRGWQC